MLDFLEFLDQVTKSDFMDEEMQQAAQRRTPYWDKVHKAFSLQFADEMAQADEAFWLLECREHFARGLWLVLKSGQFSEQGPGGGARDR